MIRNDGAMTMALAGQCIIKEDVRRIDVPEFAGVQELIRSADAALTSMEGTIRGPVQGWPLKVGGPVHYSDPVVLDTLAGMGFNIVALANNHAFDLGPEGIVSTLAEIGTRDITHAGIGLDERTALKPGIRQLKGGKVALVAMDAGPQNDNAYAQDANARNWARPGNNRLKINSTVIVKQEDLERFRAISESLGNEVRKESHERMDMPRQGGVGFDFFGVRLAAGDQYAERRRPDPADEERQLRTIREAAAIVDHVIVYLHHHLWEPEWEIAPLWFREFARKCVDAGARIVVSHGTPLLQGIEIYKGVPIFCGLGNFIFHTFKAEKYTDDRIWQSVVATLKLTRGKVESVELQPIVLGGEQALAKKDFQSRRVPHFATGDMATRILTHLAEISEPFGTRIDVKDGRGYVELP